jgi:hypothetical protein
MFYPRLWISCLSKDNSPITPQPKETIESLAFYSCPTHHFENQTFTIISHQSNSPLAISNHQKVPMPIYHSLKPSMDLMITDPTLRIPIGNQLVSMNLKIIPYDPDSRLG